MVIGYTTGAFDLFHIGHLNLLKNAKAMCDKLIVGVTTDELISYKDKKPWVAFEDRIEIVRSCKYVDVAVPQNDMDKLTACKKLHADILFVGDDWYQTEKWIDYEKSLKENNINVIYFPRIKGYSSTKIQEAISKNILNNNTYKNSSLQIQNSLSDFCEDGLEKLMKEEIK